MPPDCWFRLKAAISSFTDFFLSKETIDKLSLYYLKRTGLAERKHKSSLCANKRPDSHLGPWNRARKKWGCCGVATSGHKQLHSSDYSSLHFRGTWERIIVLQNIGNTFLLGQQRVGEAFCDITSNTKCEEGDFNYLLKELPGWTWKISRLVSRLPEDRSLAPTALAHRGIDKHSLSGLTHNTIPTVVHHTGRIRKNNTALPPPHLPTSSPNHPSRIWCK